MVGVGEGEGEMLMTGAVDGEEPGLGGGCGFRGPLQKRETDHIHQDLGFLEPFVLP